METRPFMKMKNHILNNAGRMKIVQILTCILIIIPGLALGAVHPEILTLFIALGVAVIILLMTSKNALPGYLDLPSYFILALLVLTIFQLIPLPSQFVKYLSPETFNLRGDALKIFVNSHPAFMPLTLDSSLTLLEAGKLFVYLAVYLSVKYWLRHRGRDHIINLIIYTGLISAVIFLFHRIFLIDEVYGFYIPVHKTFDAERISAPLINPNHMAALLGLVSPLAIARALSVTKRSKKALFILVCTITGTTLLLTLSRGGIAAFVCGQFIFILLKMTLQSQRREAAGSPFKMVLLPMGLAFSIGIGFFIAQDAIVGEFVGGDTKKITIALEGLKLSNMFSSFGVGRGAFQVAFPLVSDLSSNITFTHAENIIVQILADYGAWSGGLVLLIALFVFCRLFFNFGKMQYWGRNKNLNKHAYVSRRKTNKNLTMYAAGIAAITAFTLHNLVDFNLEIPGVAVIAVAIISLLYNQTHHKVKVKKNNFLKNKLGTNIIFLCVTGLGIFLFISNWFYVSKYYLDKEERTFARALQKHDVNFFNDKNLLRAFERHPASWYLPLAAGLNIVRNSDKSPLGYFSRSLALNSYSSSAHLNVGKFLLNHNYLGQALLEFRLAARGDSSYVRHIAKILVKKTPSFEKLKKIALTRNDKLLLWPGISKIFSITGYHDESQKADIEILKINKGHFEALLRQAMRYFNSGEYKKTIELANSLVKISETHARGTKLKYLCLKKLGRNNEAYSFLESQLKRVPDNDTLLRLAAGARLEMSDKPGSEEAVSMLYKNATTITRRSQVLCFEASLKLLQKRYSDALSLLRQAYEIYPENLNPLKKMAHIAKTRNEKLHWLYAITELRKKEPSNPEWKKDLPRL